MSTQVRYSPDAEAVLAACPGWLCQAAPAAWGEAGRGGEQRGRSQALAAWPREAENGVVPVLQMGRWWIWW